MATSDAQIVSKMRAAQIPPQTFHTSLKTMRLMELVDIIAKRSFDKKEFGLSSYILRVRPNALIPTPEKVVGACATFAKELVLLNQTVRYRTLGELMAAVDAPEWASDIMPGYLVVADLGENINAWPQFKWQSVQSLLLAHRNCGGGLIIGDTGVCEMGLWGFDFVDALGDIQEVFLP